LDPERSRLPKKIVVVGHGAMGTVFGVALQRAGHDVVFLGRNHIKAGEPNMLDLEFLHIDGRAERVRMDVVRDPSVVVGADLVSVLVKRPDTIDAIEPFAPFLSDETPVVTLQNGLRAAEHIRGILGHTRCIIPGVTSQAATRIGDHTVVHTWSGPTVLGFTDDRARTSANWIAELFVEAGIPTTVVESIDHVIWLKVAVNAAINGVTALCGVPNRVVFDDPELRTLALDIARETSLVAATQGVFLSDVGLAVVETAQTTGRNRSSMLQDMDAGRPTEASAIYGEIRSMAYENGVATPRIDAIHDLIEARSRTAGVKEKTVEQFA